LSPGVILFEGPFCGHAIKVTLGYPVIAFENGPAVLIKVEVLVFKKGCSHLSRLNREG
jgi:hypothetical protein